MKKPELKDLQDQINSHLEKEQKVPLEIVLDNFLKREGFIHIKELSFVLKSKTKSKLIYQELKKKLPELTIESCPFCENIINYYNKNKYDYGKCPHCNSLLDETIKTKILLNYKHLKEGNKLILIEDIKEKIKSFNLKESLYEILEESQEDIINFLNSLK